MERITSTISSPKTTTYPLHTHPVLNSEFTNTKIIYNKSESLLLPALSDVSKKYRMNEVRIKKDLNVQTLPSTEEAAKKYFKDRKKNFSEVLSCYRDAIASQSLQYTAKGVQQFSGVERRSFELVSQTWSPGGLVHPSQWKHTVNIYIPSHALHGKALLIANNGINNPSENEGIKASSDFSEEMMLKIAKETRTIVISVSDIPNQYLTYTDDGRPRSEDDSVAHSWQLFLEDSEERAFMPLHIPMMGSLVQTMNLAQKELDSWKVNNFFLTGASKRGWAAWLATVADPRVSAVIPFAIDILNTSKILNHTYKTYGKNWPLAFTPYQKKGILSKLQTKNFRKLLQIIDPLSYSKSAYGKRLAAKKYIVSASSDEFFVSDSSRLYFDKLPGQKALRVAPNSSHMGIRAFIVGSLIPFVNRLQKGRPLPVLDIQSKEETGKTKLLLRFSEKPTKIVQWTAVNPLTRDFRYTSGIRYQSQEVAIPSSSKQSKITIEVPKEGWSATFVELEFSDGWIITTPVYVMPNTYPKTKVSG